MKESVNTVLPKNEILSKKKARQALEGPAKGGLRTRSKATGEQWRG